MGLSGHSLLLMFLVIGSALEKPSVAESRPLASPPQQGYAKIFATLGLACKCCDGAAGECRSSWDGLCSNLQCLPWKLPRAV